ncbi:MAG: hypothetical protein MRK01_10300 [Candidatus Scalindua sp.]|nr:hypothetical protein [Candidatus Scalindua sp.]
MANKLEFLKNSSWDYRKFVPPDRLPEPVIQAEIYKRLQDRNIKCTVGCPIVCEAYKGALSPDIAIISLGYVVGIIEIKSFKKVKSLSNKIINNIDPCQIKSKQLKRYLLYNIPLYYCTDWGSIPHAVAFAELCIHEFEQKRDQPVP